LVKGYFVNEKNKKHLSKYNKMLKSIVKMKGDLMVKL